MHRPPGTATKRLSTKSASGLVTGKREALKKSQAYPRMFGQAIAKIYRELAHRACVDDLLEEDVAALVAFKLVSKQGKAKRARAE